jgi:hypothetical protein
MTQLQIPESEMEGESDYQRWLFETRRKEWEAEQEPQEDKEEGLPDHTL